MFCSLVLCWCSGATSEYFLVISEFSSNSSTTYCYLYCLCAGRCVQSFLFTVYGAEWSSSYLVYLHWRCYSRCQLPTTAVVYLRVWKKTVNLDWRHTAPPPLTMEHWLPLNSALPFLRLFTLDMPSEKLSRRTALKICIPHTDRHLWYW